MAKNINFDSKDELTISENIAGVDPVTSLPNVTGTFRSVQDWQLEKHLSMLEPDMTIAQKTKAQSIIAKFKK